MKPTEQRRPVLRGRELVLLCTALLAGAIGLACVALVATGSIAWQDMQPLVVIAAVALIAHLIFTVRAPGSDQIIFPVATMVTIIGMVAIQRFSNDPLLGELGRVLPGRQMQWIMIGVAVTLAAVFVPGILAALRRYRYVWLLGGLVLAAAAVVVGEDVTGSGARLWIAVGPWRFQPSEVLKVLMVAFLASYLDERQELLVGATVRLGPLRLPPLPYLLPLLIIWGLSLAVLILQEDLGVAVLFFAIFLTMLYMATGKATYLWLGLALFAAGAVVAFAAFGHVQARLAVWLNPWADPAGQGYQSIQGLLALASGGVFGVGLGYGQPGYIPAVHNDLILAALGEEIGLAGVLAVVALCMVLVTRGMHIALNTTDGFLALLAAGLSSALGLQILLIVGGTLRVLPLTGITLPFISYGGSSIITNYLIVGLLLRISMERQAS